VIWDLILICVALNCVFDTDLNWFVGGWGWFLLLLLSPRAWRRTSGQLPLS
jgi:hypothetical protein